MKINLLVNQIMAIKLYVGAECVVLQPDRNEDVQRGPLGCFSPWQLGQQGPLLPAYHIGQKNTVLSRLWKV